MIRNAAMRDQQLSLKAKGLLGVMLSYPDDWVYYMDHLEAQSTDGRDATRNAMKELLTAGYVVRRPARKSDGTLHGYEYLVADYRQTNNEPNGNPSNENDPTKNNDYQEPPVEPTTATQTSRGERDSHRSTGNPSAGKPASRRNRPPEEPADGKPATTKTDSTKTQNTKTQSSRGAPADSAGESPTTTLEEKKLDKRIEKAFGASLLEELQREDPRRRRAWTDLDQEEQHRAFRDAQDDMKDSSNTRTFRTVLKERLDHSAGLVRSAATMVVDEEGYKEIHAARIKAGEQRFEEVFLAGLDAGLSTHEAGCRADRERQRVLEELFARPDRAARGAAYGSEA